jgi:hypothetical protein
MTIGRLEKWPGTESNRRMNTWEIVGYVVLAALAIGILVNIRDTKRYFRIKTMLRPETLIAAV